MRVPFPPAAVLLLALAGLSLHCTKPPAPGPKPAEPPPEAAPAPERGPLGAEAWTERCAAEPGEIALLLGQTRPLRGFTDLADVADVKARLAASGGGDCAEARRELAILALNLADERLHDDSCITTPRGERRLNLEFDKHVKEIDIGRECGAALAFLRLANDASTVATCIRYGRGRDGKPRPSGSDACSPHTAEAWAENCGSDTGRQRLETLLPQIQQLYSLHELADTDELCELLEADAKAPDCTRARRQIAAAALSVTSGSIGPGCCVEREGAEVAFIQELIQRNADAASELDCAAAEQSMALMNQGQDVEICRARRDGSGGAGDGEAGDGASEEQDCCRPRMAGFWYRQCVASGRLEGKGPALPGTEPLPPEELARILARADERLEAVEVASCQAFGRERYERLEGRAQAQMATLALNLEAGFLSGCKWFATEELKRSMQLQRGGNSEAAFDLAVDVNRAGSVTRCPDEVDEAAETNGTAAAGNTQGTPPGE